MFTRFPTVTPDDTLTRIRALMRETGWRIVPVVSDANSLRLLGIIYRADLLVVSSTRSNAKANNVMNPPKITLRPQDEVLDALDLMLRSDEWYSPVVSEREKISGVLGLECVNCAVVASKSQILEKPVERYMSRDLIVVEPRDEVAKAWRLMREHRYSGLPVVKPNGEIVGVLTQYDLLRRGSARPVIESESSPRRTLVGYYMSTPPVCVPRDSSMLEAAKLMCERDIGRVFVVDFNKKLIGVVDREDVARCILEHFVSEHKGARSR
ncbi:MAG: CBS domain-containing protein [Fervidicoccaceae archaeon]